MQFTNLDFFKSLNIDETFFYNACNLPRHKMNGQIDDLEKSFMFSMIKKTKPNNILEFSTSWGYSTIIIANAALAVNYEPETLQTYEIDPFAFAHAIINLDEYGCKAHVVLGDVFEKMTIEDLNMADFLFVDSDHRKKFCENYIKYFFPHLKSGCFVAVHDICFNPINDETNLIKEFIEKNNIKKYLFVPDVLEYFQIKNTEINGTLWFQI